MSKAAQARRKKATITPTSAAKMLSKKVGYVVVGLPPASGENPQRLAAGELLHTFAGGLLDNGYLLEITQPTDRADWDRQVIDIFGDSKYDKNQILNGESFYRCQLLGDCIR